MSCFIIDTSLGNPRGESWPTGLGDGETETEKTGVTLTDGQANRRNDAKINRLHSRQTRKREISRKKTQRHGCGRNNIKRF